MSIESLSFHDPGTGRFMKAKLKSARLIEGVVELTFGVPYDIDGEVLQTPAALESGRVATA
ncbi:Uncharacterised protein [Mycobacteroides abscessus subsp. massiliense]|uniref:hypothetical protein n=1 Tax=Mycobacteroides abscessus TaxID=36809 RepID=UPI0009A76B4C|nr:hypothetical protein [Mycobacteroides abscessus]SLC05408.1 Uncharacterised protein [Mycobacteroides abscessus subsp. massiliense]